MKAETIMLTAFVVAITLAACDLFGQVEDDPSPEAINGALTLCELFASQHPNALREMLPPDAAKTAGDVGALCADPLVQAIVKRFLSGEPAPQPARSMAPIAVRCDCIAPDAGSAEGPGPSPAPVVGVQ